MNPSIHILIIVATAASSPYPTLLVSDVKLIPNRVSFPLPPHCDLSHTTNTVTVTFMEKIVPYYQRPGITCRNVETVTSCYQNFWGFNYELVVTENDIPITHEDMNSTLTFVTDRIKEFDERNLLHYIDLVREPMYDCSWLSTTEKKTTRTRCLFHELKFSDDALIDPVHVPTFHPSLHSGLSDDGTLIYSQPPLLQTSCPYSEGDTILCHEFMNHNNSESQLICPGQRALLSYQRNHNNRVCGNRLLHHTNSDRVIEVRLPSQGSVKNLTNNQIKSNPSLLDSLEYNLLIDDRDPSLKYKRCTQMLDLWNNIMTDTTISCQKMLSFLRGGKRCVCYFDKNEIVYYQTSTDYELPPTNYTVLNDKIIHKRGLDNFIIEPFSGILLPINSTLFKTSYFNPAIELYRTNTGEYYNFKLNKTSRPQTILPSKLILHTQSPKMTAETNFKSSFYETPWISRPIYRTIEEYQKAMETNHEWYNVMWSWTFDKWQWIMTALVIVVVLWLVLKLTNACGLTVSDKYKERQLLS